MLELSHDAAALPWYRWVRWSRGLPATGAAGNAGADETASARRRCQRKAQIQRQVMITTGGAMAPLINADK